MLPAGVAGKVHADMLVERSARSVVLPAQPTAGQLLGTTAGGAWPCGCLG